MAKNLIYLTGLQGAGKTTLCGMFRDSSEIETENIQPNNDPHAYVKDVISLYSSSETIIITSQIFKPSTRDILREVAKAEKMRFVNLKIKSL